MAEFFAGASLVNKTGAAATLEVGPDAVVGVFFSSSWCPDCKPFVLTLAAMYEELNEDGKVFEVVFVSSDHDAAGMASYMTEKHEDWLAVAYDAPLRNELKVKYGACAGSEQADVGVEPRKHGIPTLIIVKPDGTEVCDGSDDVTKYAGRGMPAAWKA